MFGFYPSRIEQDGQGYRGGVCLHEGGRAFISGSRGVVPDRLRSFRHNLLWDRGVCYAHVPGFIRDSKYKTNKDGRPISSVIPIADPLTQKGIRKAIGNRETVQQVEF